MNYDDQLPPVSKPVSEPVPARRRRVTRRSRIPTDAEGQAALIASLAKRAYPSVELFVLSLLCGAVLGLGFMLDSQAVLLLGILLAPLMTPWVGFLLAILTGSIRFLFETLMALIISAALIFGAGLLTGYAARVFLPLNTSSAIIHSRLWLPELIVLIIGAILLVASFVRSEAKPFLPSVVVAYVLFLPLNAAGFGLGAGVEGIWPQGALVAATHLAMASLFGLLTLFALRLRPSLGGLILSLIAGLAFIGVLVVLMGPGLGSAFAARELTTPTNPPAVPSSTVSLIPASTDSPTPNASPTRRIATATNEDTPAPVPLTLDVTLPASETPTITLTIEPTPVYGKIASDEGGGVNLRNAPNGKYLATIGNDSIVEVLPGIEEVNGVAWAHVIATKNGKRIEGWILESTLLYPTPISNWEPTPTITRTPTITPTP